MSQPFSYLFRVRYAECDPQGVVFNGRYVEYADVAFTEFVRSALGGYQELIDQMKTQLFDELEASGGLVLPVRRPAGDRLDQRKLP